MTNHYRNLTNMNENRVYPTGVQSQFGTTAARTSAPPLPPRPFQTQSNVGVGMGTPYGSSYSNYGGYGNSVGGYGGYGGYGMGSMGYSGYGGLGAGYGGYGTMYGGGYNRFGAPFGANNMESRFIQMVEDSSRPAFQSIESVVGAFSGIAAMLDSTYMAMTSSFRAILGVAENFGRLRSLFAQFWSTFAVLRGLNWIYRKLLSLLGIRTQDAGKAEAWANALNSSAQGKKTSSWPILMFLGIIVAAPYIILKLFGGLNRTIIEKCSDPTTWPSTIPATVLYDLSNVCSGELPLRASQTVHIAPADVQQQLQLGSTGWVLATIDNKTSGLVPTNYIKVISPGQGNNSHAKNTSDGAYVRSLVNDFQFHDSLPVIHENSWKENEQKINTENTQFEEQPL